MEIRVELDNKVKASEWLYFIWILNSTGFPLSLNNKHSSLHQVFMLKV